ncbi:hypothetical protein PO878_11220 [Iamia majanohamensis]|uniref:Glycosyltransferase RgtA/B/C/D-like domain-containing protein n=1 Tax=Iamia majanohamensis TaxID=467976 RepID=A0AAE9Y6B1_9ACTN|nr:hypothetical protein [Iamia majanohamensis]WCO65068.1 hypothetical protein PO878_11220 [Iamia majanohamensis]
MTATIPSAASRDLDSPAPPDPPQRWPRAVLGALARLVEGRRGTVLAVVLVALGVALPLPTLFHYQGPPMEEGFMLVFPERVLAGDIPNRDFLHLYGPGSLWGLAAWFEVAGTTLAAERVYGLVQHLGIIFGLFTLALPWGRRVATACGLLGVLLVVTPIGLTALAWNGAVALAVVGCALALRGAREREAGGARATAWLVAGGVFFGLSLLWRPDLVVGVGLALLALGWRRWRRDLVLPVLAGLVAGVAPILVHLATAGIGPSFEGMFLQPVFELRGGRTLPIPPSWDSLDGALAAVAQLRVPGWPLPMLAASQQVTLWFLALPLAAFFVLGTGIVALRREPGRATSRTLLVVGALGVGLLPQALQRPDTTHLAWVSCVPLVFLPVAVAQWGRWWRERRPEARRPAAWVVPTVAALLPLMAVVLVLPAYTARTWVDLTRQNLQGDYFGWAVRNGDRTFYLGSPEIADRAQQVTDELAARIEPGDRLLVGTADLRQTPYSDAYFYFLFPEAVPATRYIEMDPGIANAEDSGLAEEVASADWLILSHVWDSWDEPNDSRLLGSDAPNQVVDEQFCQVGPTGEYYELYQRC